MDMWRDALRRTQPTGFCPVEIRGGLDHTDWGVHRLHGCAGGIPSEGYGHGGPGVCLGDGQTEADEVPSQRGRGDALLRRMPLYVT